MRASDHESWGRRLPVVALLIGLTTGVQGGATATVEPGNRPGVADAPILGSPSYKMKRVVLSGLTGYMTSASLKTTVVASPTIGAAGVCPDGTATATGFWSMLGLTPVPVVLTVGLVSPGTEDVALSWTGHAAAFDVYRGTGRQSLADLESTDHLLLSTGICEASDLDTDGLDLLFFSVTPDPSGAATISTEVRE